MDSLKAIDYDELRKEIRSMVVFSEKRYLTGISWSVDTSPEEAMMYENDDCRPLKNEEWNTVHHVDCNTAYLIVPLTRFSDVTEVLPIGKEITAKSVISKVYDFYHTPLTQQQIDDVSNFECSDLGYCDELIKMSKNGNTVRYVDLRGAAVYFEGIQRVAGNVYKLHFGS